METLTSSYLLKYKPRFGYVYLIKYKFKVFDKFKDYQRMVEKQTDKSIKALRFDQRGEYLSSEFFDHLK